MDDIQDLLDEIEDELHQELEVTEVSHDKAQQAVERSLTISTPVRRFYERYRDGNDEKRQELFDDWRLRFLNRARNDPGANKIRRRFMQYLNLGANSRVSKARTAAREGYISSSGGLRNISSAKAER
jgi:truncated hemoglobin YjbI